MLPADFESLYSASKREFEAAFEEVLAKSTFLDFPEGLREAILYSLRAGGKRFRPVLALKSAETVSLPKTAALKIASALEIVHTYSLIHDDLPAMDNDVLRRGKPTNHIQFDEATAILAGDAMQALALEILCDCGLEVTREAARYIGGLGLVGGQFLDMHADSDSPLEELLETIHSMKTGQLIRLSITLPYMAAGTRNDSLSEMQDWGASLGKLFQMSDDYLDAVSDSAQLGKTAGKDSEQKKLTYVSLYGISKTRELMSELAESLSKRASLLFANNRFFEGLPLYLTRRTS